eukprot:snap_masked-scaffold671_size114370-processed-gene-0.9 protein:Tk06017 transcript:snap_masked-scaffold671_size114370-processed-gene-0.9-mRNA-1 annotation:"nuclear protein localization protein 4 homolog"
MPASQITLGLRSSSGRQRLTLASSASASVLRTSIAREMGLSEDFKLKRDQNGRPGEEILMGRTANLRTMRLNHGDVIYVVPVVGTRFEVAEEEEEEEKNGSEATPSTAGAVAVPAPTEDAVDALLTSQTGRIAQERTPNCGHPTGQKCIYCAPKDPYDEEYLKSQGIKHMSFHAHLRKLRGKLGGLEDISCAIKSGRCSSHKPWPAGICSRCQPSAITLNRQPYRHVDNLMFENPHIVDTFLAYWRATGAQRMGLLYGVYEAHADVPLGIKARVATIYEPPQECSKDGIRILTDENEARVEAVAAALGLYRVGWIFTDLVHDSQGYLKHFRHVDSHFLSAQECIMAGLWQSRHPNPCRLATNGLFGSKFGTVLVTGNTEKQVHMEGYQVSNQCMALARDGCLVPTKDAPELGYVRESTSEKYVPDVFYKEKDKYGNEVTKIARPLPVEYLLIDVPVSTPLEPVHTFHVAKRPFPIENRPMEGHLQDFASLAAHRHQFVADLPNLFRDFHLLLYLATQNVNPLWDHMSSLLTAVKEDKGDAILAWSKSEHWQTIELLLEAGYN